MEISKIRQERLRKWFENRSIPEREKSYISQLLSGKSPFGERAARRLEGAYGMASRYLDGAAPATVGGLAADELELLRNYREAESVWRLTIRLIAGATPNLQPELSHDVNMIMARLVGGPVKPISNKKMRGILSNSKEGFPPRQPNLARKGARK